MGSLESTAGIVTGAAQGIGLGIARALAKEGMSLVLVDLAADAVSQAAESLTRETGVTCLPLVGDVTESQTATEAVNSALEAFGRLDALVNNAQKVERQNISFMDHRDEDLAIALDSGLWATFWFMQAAFEALAADEGGSVVNLASSSGTHGQPGFAGYAATKEAIRGLTKTAALEWGEHGITVNAVCPAASSPTADAHFARHPGRAEAKAAQRAIAREGDAETDVGRSVAYLAGPGARYVTGVTLMVNGGMVISP